MLRIPPRLHRGFRRTLRCVVAAGFLLAAAPAGWAREIDLTVIVNPSNPLDQLSRIELSNIYFGKTLPLPGGSTLNPVDAPENSAEYAGFAEWVHGRTLNQMKRTWAKIIFTGQAVLPRQMPPEAILKHVAATPDSIGYVPKRLVDGSVKTIAIIE